MYGMDNCSCKSCQNTNRSERLARPSTVYKCSNSWHCNVWFHGVGVAMLQHNEAIMNLCSVASQLRSGDSEVAAPSAVSPTCLARTPPRAIPADVQTLHASLECIFLPGLSIYYSAPEPPSVVFDVLCNAICTLYTGPAYASLASLRMDMYARH
jgi:hypothetical protein